MADKRPQRRRLAFVIHDMNPWGGHDRSTLEVAKRLSHRWPVDVCAYTLEDPAGMRGWGEVRFRRVKPHFKHPAVARISIFYGASLPPLVVAPRYADEPAPLVHATGSCSLVSDIVQVQFVNAAWKKVTRTLSKEYCKAPRARQQAAGGGRTSLLANMKSGAVEAYHEWLLSYNVAVEHLVYSKKKTYIAIAHCVADELRDCFGLPSEQIKVIHHGVDSQAFRPAGDEAELIADRAALRAKFGFSDADRVFSLVGAFERKGLAVAIDALGLLPRELRARVKLLGVGAGSREGFMAAARKAEVESQVVLQDPVKDIARYYRASDAFVLPTFYEPFGLVILEAMSCGLAVAVSKLAGASELIRDGEDGLLIQNPEDPREIAAHMARIAQDDGLHRKLGANARRVAVGRSWDRVADEYAAVIEPLMKANGGRS